MSRPIERDPLPPAPKPQIPPEAFQDVRRSGEFNSLRRTFRGFAFPMTAAFLIWYAFYVLMSTLAPDVMSHRVIGNVTSGLLLSLGQFISTFLITWLYIRHMNKKVDPLARQIREDLEERAR